MDVKWHVYIVRCADESLYCGIAVNVQQRVHQHNNTLKGSKYTRTRRPVVLVWSEDGHTHSSALKRELEIKKFSRIKKLNLIESKR